MEQGYRDHKDKIIARLIELTDKTIGERELAPLLLNVYDDILPVPAKIFVRPNSFVNACLEQSDELLKAVNKHHMRQRLSLV